MPKGSVADALVWDTLEAYHYVRIQPEADHDVLHQQRVVSDSPCLCVVALDGVIQIDGWLGRLMQPFVRL